MPARCACPRGDKPRDYIRTPSPAQWCSDVGLVGAEMLAALELIEDRTIHHEGHEDHEGQTRNLPGLNRANFIANGVQFGSIKPSFIF